MKKIALVTGASSGLGKDFTKALLKEGFTVYAAARRIEEMENISRLGAIPVKVDITKEEDIHSVVEKIKKEQGQIDLLVNNAGFGLFGAVEDTDINDARYQFEVNLFGLAHLTQLLLPMMREKRSGKIINISSMGGKVYTPLGAWYHATKFALEGFSDCLRIELAPFNIFVVVIEPGVVKTNFGKVLIEPMMKRSGDGPYREMATAVEKATFNLYENGEASNPEVITKCLIDAVRSNAPETRYVAGKYAKAMLLLHRWLGDAFFDKIVTSMLKWQADKNKK